MNPLNTLRIALLAGTVFAASRLAGDVVETRNGARLVGSITLITDGNVHLKTEYAGEIVVKQSEVTAISTDSEIAVRLASGSVLQGRASTAGSVVRIRGADGEVTTPVSGIAATWAAGAEDPAVVAQRPHWSYEASVNVNGKTGNSEQLGTTVNARATMKTPRDTLQFYTGYDRQVADGTKAADQFKAGIDFQDNFSGRKSWYVRDEGGFDRIRQVDFYDIAAVGLGYDLIKEAKHTLTVRTGLSYRYEHYLEPTTPTVSSAGLDLALNHEWEFARSRLVDRIDFVPSFNEFSNFRLTHESFYEVPLADPFWKLRVGVSNDYNSRPAIGLKKLDTSYFTQLVLIWQ